MLRRFVRYALVRTAVLPPDWFPIHSEEDYVDLARAKGLPPAAVRRRYILRPTIHDAHANSALLNEHYYWILLPASLLLLTSLGFALVGSDLERILNPRLSDS